MELFTKNFDSEGIKQNSGLTGDVNSLSDKVVSQKIQTFLGKIKPIKYYYIDEKSNTLIIGLDGNYMQSAINKIYKEASTIEYFDSDSVKMEYFPTTKDTQYTIRIKNLNTN